MIFRVVLEDTETGKQYKRVQEQQRDSCVGCAFNKNDDLCAQTPDVCGEMGIIYVEHTSV